MSFDIFLNYERLSIDIIEAEIAQMTNDNTLREFGGIVELDDEKLMNNLYHGCVAATFIVSLYESTLNTILGRRFGRAKKDLRMSHDNKLKLICEMNHIDVSEIKKDRSFACLQSVIDLRNDITHYKCNLVSKGHFISETCKIPIGNSKDALAVQFTKDYMEKCYRAVVNLLELICQKCGLVLYKDCLVIDSDGRDYACEFVLTKEVYDKRNEQ